MRAIHVDEIRAAVRKLCIDANLYLPSDVTAALENLSKKENSPLTEMCLTQFRANREVAAAEGLGALPGYRNGGRFYRAGAGSADLRWIVDGCGTAGRCGWVSRWLLA